MFVEKKAETDDVDRIKIRRHLNAGFRFELGDPNNARTRVPVLWAPFPGLTYRTMGSTFND